MNWYESDNPSVVARGAGWRLMVWIVVFVVFFGLIGIGAWLFGVGSSDIKGQGDAYQQKNSAENRVRAQEEYVATYNDILAADRRVQVMSDALSAAPSSVNQTNYTGAVNYCIQRVADYNGLIDKYTSADFIPEGYPEKISDLNTETDCKENEK